MVTAAAIALCGSTAVAAAAPAFAVEGGQPAILQIGDSFASGEGGGWKGNSNNGSGNRSGTDMAAYLEDGTWKYDPHRVYHHRSFWNHQDSWADGCHESLHAPIRSLKNSHPGDYTVLWNFACSGAHTRNLWKLDSGGESYNGRLPQLHNFQAAIGDPQDLKLIAISAGGNDAGFGDAIRTCLKAWGYKHVAGPVTGPFDEICHDDVRDDIVPRVKDVYYNLTKTVKQVREELALAGQAQGSYRIVLQGYPTILPTEANDWSYAEDNWANRCYVTREDSKWINENFVTRLNRMVRAVAEEQSVGFIDNTDAFVGHRLCEYGTVRGSAAAASSANAEWVRFVDVNISVGSVLWDVIKKLAPPNGHWPLYDEEVADMLNSQRHVSESFHPNYWGQQALGECLSLYFHNTTGPAKVRCYNGGGQAGTVDQMAIASLGGTPTIVDDPTPNLAIPQDGILQREIVVPDSVPPGFYVAPFLDLTHPRKGQLRISLLHRETGTIFTIRDYNPVDTGAWYDWRWPLDYSHSIFWPPPPIKDPSGHWLLTIAEHTEDGFSGTFNGWNMRVY
ncbi:GDSL-type esterase/lipase family protein [Allorhizocola rhizosphaerae]|uniref:GDSL-type esterase/lipase family protein n=1 Tax=Allorhizocola rhizosphaerae TaxID=1872709 RepID=UPI0013C2C143|nr:GDSL-type esterase/lipase family protein [Allorhizocola rhizosphaerae]